MAGRLLRSAELCSEKDYIVAQAAGGVGGAAATSCSVQQQRGMML